MAKKQKKEEDIPRPEKDVRMPKDKSFKEALGNFIKKTTDKPKPKKD